MHKGLHIEKLGNENKKLLKHLIFKEKVADEYQKALPIPQQVPI